MPMRGNLPVKNLLPSEVGQVKDVGQFIKGLLGSPDLEVIFGVCRHWPVAVALFSDAVSGFLMTFMALFAQFP